MKIMIVEDEKTIRDMLGESLAKWGFEVVTADEFEDVLQVVISEKPHLILLDINLPSFDGFYWCSKIREFSKVPVIFISSRDSAMDMVMAMNMGGDDFIQKPFDTNVLIAKINALLRRSYSYMDIEPNVLEHNGVILDLKDWEIIYQGNKADLTKTEFIILRLLMQQKGTVVNRTKMMRSLWKDESFIDDNTLTVNITRLRKKLAELGKDDFISTKRGEGYIIQ
ncbi:MAG TPA: response regulator transcription factor [Bacillus sp. (in: firmicutes)]|uniref:response regulator transcription factor n=1 Tax=Bacillus litorisediminis TaxID=2922713 RepID=UPI0028BEE934|nr:response regulator transcription factor [Bacillus litorisediminis]HWO77836.1 response regulator transcription factor [Bacillus sp. (in: firmicutes)]